MTHAEAVAIIRAPRRDGPESYLLYSAACAKVYVDHIQQIRPGSFTTDAPARRARDIGGFGPSWETARTNPEVGTGRADGGTDPGSRSGARLVQRLEGPVTSYFIANDGDGNACLFQTVGTGGALDPYRTATGTRVAATADRAALQRDAQVRDELRQLEQKVIASGVAAFWREPPTRDAAAAAPQGKLGAAAAAFWDRQQRGAA